MLSRTAKYYRDNPKARKKHRKTSAKHRRKKKLCERESNVIYLIEKTRNHEKVISWIVLTEAVD